jgi:hypothetical protein
MIVLSLVIWVIMRRDPYRWEAERFLRDHAQENSSIQKIDDVSLLSIKIRFKGADQPERRTYVFDVRTGSVNRVLSVTGENCSGTTCERFSLQEGR